MTRTYTEALAAADLSTEGEVTTVFVQDFSSRPAEPDPAVIERLGDTYRQFDTLREAAEWLHSVGAIMARMMILPRPIISMPADRRPPSAEQETRSDGRGMSTAL